MTSAPVQPPRRAYRVRPPELWAAVRAAWEAGENPAALERLYDVPLSTTLNRAKREGWLRQPEPPPPPLSEPVVVRPLRGSLEIAEAALAVASEALQRGRAADAVALIKAGDSVGAFADFVSNLRARAARGEFLFNDERPGPGPE